LSGLDGANDGALHSSAGLAKLMSKGANPYTTMNIVYPISEMVNNAADSTIISMTGLNRRSKVRPN
ncbi:hypothetical protein K443DRAFT_32149, partial [Laccaria amethystina LaAM-08-1]